jgi:hypothetical protein
VAESQEEPFSQALTAWNQMVGRGLAEMFGILLDLVFWLELV